MVGNLQKEQYAPTKWAVDKIHELGGYAFLAHPYWISGNRYHLDFPIFEQMLENGDIDGVEVIGGYPPWDFESNMLAVAKYYSEVAKGRKIPVLGNSDTHSRTTVDIYGHWIKPQSKTGVNRLDTVAPVRTLYAPNQEKSRLSA